MKKNEYYDLIEMLKKYNLSEGNNDRNLHEIEKLFISYPDLMSDFRKIFSQINKN